jgi:hypothetical protein
MRKYFRKILFILGFFGMAKNSKATTYWVDFDGGNDSHSGLSSSTSWKNLPEEKPKEDDRKKMIVSRLHILQVL